MTEYQHIVVAEPKPRFHPELLDSITPFEGLNTSEILRSYRGPFPELSRRGCAGSRTMVHVPEVPHHRAGFLDLPTELRQRVYHINITYILDTRHARLDHGVKHQYVRSPTPPPITRICRMLREEALDIWYATARSPLHFRALSSCEGSSTSWPPVHYELAKTLPPWAYPKLRKLELCFECSVIDGISPFYCRFPVDLDAHMDSYTLDRTTRAIAESVDLTLLPFPRKSREYFSAVMRAARLLKVFDAALASMIKNSGGIRKLTFRDYERLTPDSNWHLYIPD